MNIDQFIDKYKGKGVDVDNYPPSNPYQCVDLIRQYIKEVLGQPQPKGVTGAKDFFTNYETDPNLNKYFDKIPNTPDGVPKKGDIIIWGSTYGPYGHIAIINWANVNQFQVLSQNDPIGSKTALKNYSYKHILGWFHPKETMPDTIQLEKEKFEELVTKATKLDELAKLGYDNPDRVKILIEKVKKYEEKISNFNAKTDELNKQIKELEETIQKQEKSISGLRGEITKKEKEIAELQEAPSTPVLEGKRKLLAGIVSSILVFLSKFLSEKLGFELTVQELALVAAGGLSYVTAEGTKDIIEVLKGIRECKD